VETRTTGHRQPPTTPGYIPHLNRRAQSHMFSITGLFSGLNNRQTTGARHG
jgi:hypothetical protein